MRSLLALLFLCFSLSVVTAQTTVKKKPTTTVKKPTYKKPTLPAAKRPVARPRPTPLPPPPVEPTASTLTFPSTDPDDAATMDAAKKQQLYDELHGVKNQPVTPETGKKGRTRKDKQADRQGETAGGRVAGSAGDEAGTYIGIRAGGNYTSALEGIPGVDINGNPGTFKFDPFFGFQAGVVFQFGRGGIAFQPEINFNQDYVTTTVSSGTGISTVTSTQSFNSLVVPLLAKFQFGQQGSTRFFVNVGPYGVYSLESQPAGAETVIGYGAALGIGVGIPTGGGKFVLEARGYYPLGSTAEGSEFGNVPFKPITANLSVGYLFPLGRR